MIQLRYPNDGVTCNKDREDYTCTHRTMSHAQCVAKSLKSVIIEAWTFGYVKLMSHSPGIASELMDIHHRILLIELMDIQHWQTG